MARIFWLVVILGLALPSVAVAAPDPAAVGKDADHVLGQSHQRELPGFDGPAPRLGDGRGHGAGHDRDDSSAKSRRNGAHVDPRPHRPRDPGDRAAGDDQDHAPGGPLSSLATMVLWCLVAAAALVLAMAAYRQFSDYVGDDQPGPDGPAKDLQLAAVIERPRDDADELAAHERYADAIHTLLLRTLHELASQRLVRVTPSMTSREILARVALDGDARLALAGLIVAVEQTWFGDDVPQLADYQRCRAQFDRFAAAYRRGVGARP